MTWKAGEDHGRLCREITNESGERPICQVYTWQSGYGYGDEPWPEGEAHFRLILQAPQMLEALEEIYTKVERMMQANGVPVTWLAVLAAVRKDASTAIAAAKGEQ